MSEFKCPHCGKPFLLLMEFVKSEADVAAMGWKREGRSTPMAESMRHRWHNYGSDFRPGRGGPWDEWRPYQEASGIPGDIAELTRERPARGMTWQGDFLVPLAWSAVSGFFALTGSLSLTLAFHWPVDGAIVFSLAAGFLAAGGVWAWRLTTHSRSMWDIERIINRDLDGDGAVGQPVTRVEVTMPKPGGGGSMHFIDIAGVEADDLQAFFRAVGAGGSLTVGSWAGAGKPFTRPQYDALMAKLEGAGLIENRGGNVGRVLSKSGRAVFKRLAGG
jgi:hypothetical protein